MKKGPQRSAPKKLKVTKGAHKHPDTWFNNLLADLNTLQPFSEQGYQSLLTKYKLLIPNASNKTFHINLQMFLIELTQTNLVSEQSPAPIINDFIHKTFSITMGYRILLECSPAKSLYRNEYLYLFYNVLNNYLIVLSQCYYSDRFTLELKNIYLSYIQRFDPLFQQHLPEFVAYLKKIPTSKQLLDVGVRKQLFTLYKNLALHKMYMAQIFLLENKLEEAVRAHSESKAYCTYIENNLSQMLKISGEPLIVSNNIFNYINTSLNTLNTAIQQHTAGIYVLKIGQPKFDFTEAVSAFKHIYEEFNETSEWIAKKECTPNITSNNLSENIIKLTATVNQQNQEVNPLVRLSNFMPEHAWQTQALLRDIRKSSDLSALRSNLSAALTLTIAWKRFFTGEVAPQAKELLNKHINPLLEKITITLKKVMQIQLPKPFDYKAEIDAMIDEASNIRASIREKAYREFMVKHVSKLGNPHFSKQFFTDALSYLSSLLPSSPEFTDFETLHEFFEQIEKRINALQCILVVTSPYMTKNDCIQYINVLWTDLRDIFEQTAAIFKADIVPHEYTTHYIDRVYHLSSLVEHYAEQFEKIMQSIDPSKKIPPSRSHILIYKSFAYLANAQNDHKTSVPALKSSYEYLAKHVQQINAGSFSTDMIQEFKNELSTLFFDIYSPMFHQETLVSFLLDHPEFPNFIKYQDRVEFLSRIKNNFTFAENDAPKTLRQHLFLTQCLNSINAMSKSDSRKTELYEFYKQLLIQNSAATSSKTEPLLENAFSQPFSRVKRIKKRKTVQPSSINANHTDEDILPIPSSSNDLEPELAPTPKVQTKSNFLARWNEISNDEGPWIEVTKKRRLNKHIKVEKSTSALKDDEKQTFSRQISSRNISISSNRQIPTCSSNITPHRSYAQIVKGEYEPLNENEYLPGAVIENNITLPKEDPVDQLASQMESLSLAASASSQLYPVLSSRILLPENLFDIYCRIRYAGHLALFTGGFIRDTLLGIPPNDVDIITTCSIEELRFIFNGYGYVNPNRADLYHLNDFVDIISCPSANLMASANLRDITINALYCDDQYIYDPLGIGATLNSPELILIGSPNKRLENDPSLILRLVRFSHTLQKGLSAEYLSLMKQHAPKITSLPWGVLKSNIRALFLRNPQIAFNNMNFMFDHNIISYLLSNKAEEEKYYQLTYPKIERSFFLNRMLHNIYEDTQRSPVIEILSMLLALRLSSFIQTSRLTFEQNCDKSADLLLELMVSKRQCILKNHIKERIISYYTLYHTPEQRGAGISVPKALTPMYKHHQHHNLNQTSDNTVAPEEISSLHRAKYI